MDRTAGASIVLATVLGALLVIVAPGVIGVATEGVAAQSTNTTNITYHENPETVAERGDADRLRGWLSGRLTERLRESSVRISEGQYDRADDVFDEEFEQRVGQYVEIAGDTNSGTGSGDGESDGGGESESEAQTAFERAQEQQTRLASLQQEYDEAYAAYLDAREQGDSEAARLHARNLQRLASEIRRLGGEVTRTLTSLENETGQDTSDIEQRTRNQVETVTEIQEEVQTDTFRETSLDVATNRSNASFATPVEIRGRIVIVNGIPASDRSAIERAAPFVASHVRIEPDTAMANRTIRVRIGHVLYEPTTTANGTFTVTYRPAFVPIGAENVSVQYLPDMSAPYLGVETNTSLSVQRAEPFLLDESAGPTVTAAVTPSEARFGNTVTVDAELAVDDRPVVNVPIEAIIGTELVDTTTTTRTGTARMTGPLPATVQPGDRTVKATVGLDDPAAGPTAMTTTVTIRETNTDLRLEANATGEGVIVGGRLVADSNDREAGLAGRVLTVTVGDVTRTIRTDGSGQFETTVARTDLELADDSESVSVQARFDGSRTNIESARAVTTVNVSALTGGEGQTGGTDTTLADQVPAGVVVLIILMVGAAALAWRRWRHEAGNPSVEHDSPPQPIGAETGGDTQSGPAPLAEAHAALTDGATERAVIAAYAAARAELTDRFDLEESSTPRELLTLCERQLDREAQSRLRTLTDMYERTVFAPESVADMGQDAVDAARELLTTRPDGSEPADD